MIVALTGAKSGPRDSGLRIASIGGMTQGTVVIAGGLPGERVCLSKIVSEFGWSLEAASDLNQLEAISSSRPLVAVLFCPEQLSLSSDEALRSVLCAAPGALAILCHRFSEPIDWPGAAKAGAFHALRTPFCEREVRQSLGFVWSARRPVRAPRKLRRMEKVETAQIAPGGEIAEVA